MVVRILRIGSMVLSLLVVAGFVGFAIDESKAASEQTQQRIVTGGDARVAVDPTPEVERVREAGRNAFREQLDDANDLLLRPFVGVSETSGSEWTRRSVPALLALLTYGLGLATLARYLQTR